MPARDIYHDTVKRALVKDGWTITHDPLHLAWGGRDMYVDLGAEQLVAAEKGERKIAVEIKSFVGASEIDDLKQAIGQYVVYRSVLAEVEAERVLYLAVPEGALRNIFEEPIGQLLIRHHLAQVIGFDPRAEVIVAWIP
jgi:hypothetical protein